MSIKLSSKPASTIKNKTGGWRTYKPIIDLEKCISCGTCERVCPEGAIEMIKIKGKDKLFPKVDYSFCKGCGVCAEECPVKVVKMTLDKK